MRKPSTSKHKVSPSKYAIRPNFSRSRILCLFLLGKLARKHAFACASSSSRLKIPHFCEILCAKETEISPQNVPNVQNFLARAFGARVYRIPNCRGTKAKTCLCVCVILEGFQNIVRLRTFVKPCEPKRPKFSLKMCQMSKFSPKDLNFRSKCAELPNFSRSRLRRLHIPFLFVGGRARKHAFTQASFWRG